MIGADVGRSHAELGVVRVFFDDVERILERECRVVRVDVREIDPGRGRAGGRVALSSTPCEHRRDEDHRAEVRPRMIDLATGRRETTSRSSASMFTWSAPAGERPRAKVTAD